MLRSQYLHCFFRSFRQILGPEHILQAASDLREATGAYCVLDLVEVGTEGDEGLFETLVFLGSPPPSPILVLFLSQLRHQRMNALLVRIGVFKPCQIP